MSSNSLTRVLNKIIKVDEYQYKYLMYNFIHYPQYINTTNTSWIYDVDNDCITIQYYETKATPGYHFNIDGTTRNIEILFHERGVNQSKFNVPIDCTEEQLFQLSLVCNIGFLNIRHIKQLGKIFKKYYIEDNE